MSDNLLKAILLELKELNNRVVSRTNNATYIEHDTSTNKTYDMATLLGQGLKCNDITIFDLGGGFTISINGEKHVTATLDMTFEDEDIFSIDIKGSAAGTAIIRLSAYSPRYRRD